MEEAREEEETGLMVEKRRLEMERVKLVEEKKRFEEDKLADELCKRHEEEKREAEKMRDEKVMIVKDEEWVRHSEEWARKSEKETERWGKFQTEADERKEDQRRLTEERRRGRMHQMEPKELWKFKHVEHQPLDTPTSFSIMRTQWLSGPEFCSASRRPNRSI